MHRGVILEKLKTSPVRMEPPGSPVWWKVGRFNRFIAVRLHTRSFKWTEPCRLWFGLLAVKPQSGLVRISMVCTPRQRSCVPFLLIAFFVNYYFFAICFPKNSFLLFDTFQIIFLLFYFCSFSLPYKTYFNLFICTIAATITMTTSYLRLYYTTTKAVFVSVFATLIFDRPKLILKWWLKCIVKNNLQFIFTP